MNKLRKLLAGSIAVALAAYAFPSAAFADQLEAPAAIVNTTSEPVRADAVSGAAHQSYVPLDANEQAKLNGATNASPSLLKQKAGDESCTWYASGGGRCDRSSSSSSGGPTAWWATLICVGVVVILLAVLLPPAIKSSNSNNY